MKQQLASGLVALFLVSPIAARAQPVLGTPHNEVVAAADQHSDTVTNCGGTTVAGSVSVATNCVVGFVGNGQGSAFASAWAGLGTVRVVSSAFGTSYFSDLYNSGASSGAGAQATASLTDYFAVSGPVNSTGHLFASLWIDGNLSAAGGGWPASGAGQSGYTVQTAFGSLSGSAFGASNGTVSQTNVNGGVLPVDITLNFGPDGWAPVTYWIYAQIQVNGGASPYQECSSCQWYDGTFNAGANFGSTIYWGGITGITVNGAPLADYQVVSASGVDYRFATAVPEPAGLWLWGIGLAALGWRSRYRVMNASIRSANLP